MDHQLILFYILLSLKNRSFTLWEIFCLGKSGFSETYLLFHPFFYSFTAQILEFHCIRYGEDAVPASRR